MRQIAHMPASQLRGNASDTPGPCRVCTVCRPIIEDPRPCPVAIIGSAPGATENARGYPFCGETGRETVETYLPILGIPVDQIYKTNVVKCQTASTDETVSACSQQWIGWELGWVQPETVLTLGVEAASLFGISDLEMNNGIPTWGIFRNQLTNRIEWQGFVIPLYHTAAGLHSTDFMIPIFEGFHMAARFLAGENTVPINRWPNPDYAVIESEADAAQYFMEYREAPRAAADTETLPGHPPEAYCLSFSLAPGTGRVMLAKDRNITAMLREFLRDRTAAGLRFYMHNGPYDMPILRQMGVELRDIPWRDTMIRAYHQGDMPKALKVLGWRLCGVRMVEFEDLVRPWHLVHWRKWLSAVSSEPWPAIYQGGDPAAAAMSAYAAELANWQNETAMWKMSASEWRALPKKDRGPKPVKPGKKPEKPAGPEYRAVRSLQARAKSWFEDDKNGEATKPLDWWDGIDPRITKPAMDRFGPPPVPRIDMVPIEAVRDYACADADVTLRIAPIIEEQMTTAAILGRGSR